MRYNVKIFRQMTIFFSILLVLLGLNAILLLFSVNRTKTQQGKGLGNPSQTKVTQIYPIDWADTKYKKAI